MASKLVRPPLFTSPKAVSETPSSVGKPKICGEVPFGFRSSSYTRLEENPYGVKSTHSPKVSESIVSDFVGHGGERENEEEKAEEEDRGSSRTRTQIKEEFYHAVEGINRGIFGVPSAKKSEIEGLVELLESNNPTPDPALNLDKVDGSWKLVYSTVTILGAKRTKLGLRDFITLGDFLQDISVSEGKAVNVIKFNLRGLNLLNGQLSIKASFRTRVDITYESSTIEPDQLMNVFKKNYDLLLGIFNPQGWLEITYVDETLRVGRDDKGNTFVLERVEKIPNV